MRATSLFELRSRYRKQHSDLWFPQNRQGGNLGKTTRRQKNFRPRGGVYKRLLMLDIYSKGFYPSPPWYPPYCTR